MRNIFFPHYLSGEPVKARHKNYQENMPYRPRLQRNEEKTDKRHNDNKRKMPDNLSGILF